MYQEMQLCFHLFIIVVTVFITITQGLRVAIPTEGRINVYNTGTSNIIYTTYLFCTTLMSSSSSEL